MKGIGVLNYSCQGESHKASDKPCQDASLAQSLSDCAVAVVSDGHGGARYFRSDIGSKLAVRITKKAVSEFVREPSTANLFVGKAFRAYAIDSEGDKTYDALIWLVSSIIRQWNRDIHKDAESRPVTDWEREHIEEKYLTQLTQKGTSLEKIYGCTLMAFVRTEKYWFAFQIGDGKAVFFDKIEGKMIPSQPIPWDERCFLNKTTSICDSDAGAEFRFCCCGDGTFPEAVFLGSDGIDDTYGDGDKLTDFYARMYKELASMSKNRFMAMLEGDLPVISRLGSRDDMSVACVYDNILKAKNENYLLMSQWQLGILGRRIKELTSKAESLKARIENALDEMSLPDAERIEIQYARNDLKRAEDEIERLNNDISIINGTDAFREKKGL